MTKGQIFKSSANNQLYTFETITDKKVSFYKNDGFSKKVNVNTLRVFTTSRAKAEKYILDGHWVIQVV